MGRHSPIPRGAKYEPKSGKLEKLSSGTLDGSSGKGEMHIDLQAL